MRTTQKNVLVDITGDEDGVDNRRVVAYPLKEAMALLGVGITELEELDGDSMHYVCADGGDPCTNNEMLARNLTGRIMRRGNTEEIIDKNKHVVKYLIRKNGGAAEFRKRLADIGINIPLSTISNWNARGKSARYPPAWIAHSLWLNLEKSKKLGE